jgi:signal transduction histidine kinase
MDAPALLPVRLGTLLNRLINPVVPLDEDRQTTQRLIAAMLLVVSFMLLLAIPLHLLLGQSVSNTGERAVALLLSLVVVIGAYYLARRGYFMFLGWGLSLYGTVMVFVMALARGEQGAYELYFLIILVLFVSLLFSVRIGIILFLVQMLGVLAFGFLSTLVPLQVVADGPLTFLLLASPLVLVFSTFRWHIERRMRATQRDLRESQGLYRTLIDHFPNAAVALYDHDLRYRIAGGQELRQRGIAEADLKGKPARTELLLIDAASAEQAHRSALAGTSWSAEVQVAENTYELHTFPVCDDAGTVIGGIAISRNMTRRKAMERKALEEERLRAALRKEQELSDLKTRMMTRISHEFRTPLSILQSSGELLETYSARMSEVQRKRHFDNIRQQVGNITAMLDDIQVIMRSQVKRLTLEISDFSLVELAEEIVGRFEQTIGAEHTLRVNALGALPLFTGDRRMLEAALSALVKNAIIYSPPNSVVSVSLSAETDALIVAVEDKGIGIHPEEQPRLYEPFFRGSNVGEVSGVGLGLSIAHEIITAHAGTLRVQSAPDAGTRFTVILPLYPASAGEND